MNQKILLALDASEASMNAVRYVGEIVSQGGGFDITLFHVLQAREVIEPFPRLEVLKNDEGARIEFIDKRAKWLKDNWDRIRGNVFAPAKEILMKMGVRGAVRKSRLKVIPEAGGDLVKTILNEIREGAYGTIVLGLHEEFQAGKGKSRVVSEVIRRAEDCSVWVIEPCRAAS